MYETNWLDISSTEAAGLIHERMMAPGPIVPTGLHDVDRACWGFGDRKGIPQGTYMIVGGASNIGKTQFGLNLARRAANEGLRVGILSLDMKVRNAIMRLHQAIAGEFIPHGDWLPSRWSAENQRILEDALRNWRLSREAGDIAVYMGGGKTVDDVRAMLMEGVDAGATFFVVDHLQKIQVTGIGGDSVATRAEIVSDAMNDFAEEHDVTICALSQLNRMATRERDRQPTMADLLGGTSLESNSELILVLDHSRYQRDPRHHHIGRTFVLLEKNQFGPKGFAIPVEVDHAKLRYRQADPDEEHKWPARTLRVAR